MIAASVGKKQIGKSLMLIVAVIVLVFVTVYIVGRIRAGKGEEGVQAIPGETVEQREEYLRTIGLQVDTTSSVADVGVPGDFDERFTAYNEMLKTTGFDLTELKGETVKKCTYTVTNRTDISPNVSAVLLVHDGKIVAGHLVDNVTNALYPLFAATEPEPSAEPTILPQQEQAGAPEATQEGAEAAPEIPTDAYPSD